ncbi:hypothetical protein LTR85_000972 [Meristemomyces frigidus]|nr:hypothetical protein LTR85_000972 [Meristemomyces frigidus]
MALHYEATTDAMQRFVIRRVDSNETVRQFPLHRVESTDTMRRFPLHRTESTDTMRRVRRVSFSDDAYDPPLEATRCLSPKPFKIHPSEYVDDDSPPASPRPEPPRTPRLKATYSLDWHLDDDKGRWQPNAAKVEPAMDLFDFDPAESLFEPPAVLRPLTPLFGLSSNDAQTMYYGPKEPKAPKSPRRGRRKERHEPPRPPPPPPPPSPEPKSDAPMTGEQKRIAEEKRLQKKYERQPDTDKRRRAIMLTYARTYHTGDNLERKIFGMMYANELSFGPFSKYGNWEGQCDRWMGDLHKGWDAEDRRNDCLDQDSEDNAWDEEFDEE